MCEIPRITTRPGQFPRQHLKPPQGHRSAHPNNPGPRSGAPFFFRIPPQSAQLHQWTDGKRRPRTNRDTITCNNKRNNKNNSQVHILRFENPTVGKPSGGATRSDPNPSDPKKNSTRATIFTAARSIVSKNLRFFFPVVVLVKWTIEHLATVN